MKNIFIAGLMLLTCLGMNLAAQDWYHDRDARFHGDAWRGRLFEHVRIDLDHIGSAVFAAPREQNRLQRTKGQLADLQGKLERRFYDERELKDVIGEMATSANDQRLSPRDREILHDDVNRLRDYRDHHDRWFH